MKIFKYIIVLALILGNTTISFSQKPDKVKKEFKAKGKEKKEEKRLKKEEMKAAKKGLKEKKEKN